jgi:hypothetical protein
MEEFTHWLRDLQALGALGSLKVKQSSVHEQVLASQAIPVIACFHRPGRQAPR